MKYIFTVQTKHTFYVPHNQGLAKSYQPQPPATCLADDAHLDHNYSGFNIYTKQLMQT